MSLNTIGDIYDALEGLKEMELEVSLLENQLIAAKLRGDFIGILELELKNAKEILMIRRSDEIL
jgi:hypothetical protein